MQKYFRNKNVGYYIEANVERTLFENEDYQSNNERGCNIAQYGVGVGRLCLHSTVADTKPFCIT